MKRGSNTRRTHYVRLYVFSQAAWKYSADSLWCSMVYFIYTYLLVLNLSSGSLQAFMFLCVFSLRWFHSRTCKYFQVALIGHFVFHTIIFLINWFLKVLLFLVSAALPLNPIAINFASKSTYKYCVFCVPSLPVAVGQCCYVDNLYSLYWAAHSGHVDANKTEWRMASLSLSLLPVDSILRQ